MSDRFGEGPKGALEPPPGGEYDEDTFLYLLDVEWARAERSNRPLRLLFATMESSPGQAVPIPPESATRLFRDLRLALRDTDVMGWYRQGRVASAVLTAGDEAPGADMSTGIEQRIGDGLRQRLPSKIARSLKVRVVQLEPRRSAKG